MKPKSQNYRHRQPPGFRPSGSPEAATSPVRFLVGLLIMGCVGVALFHPRGPHTAPNGTASPAADRVEPSPPLTKTESPIEASPTATFNRPLVEPSRVEGVDLPVAEDTGVQVAPRARAKGPADVSGVWGLDPALPEVQPTDPGPGTAEDKPVVLNDREKAAGLQEIVDLVNDPAETSRLAALQYLVNHPDANAKTVETALRAALQDHDPAFVAFAIQELAGRTDPAAVKSLLEALRTGMPETRLLIVESVASNESEIDLLYQGLKDEDETVREKARTILNPTP